MEWWPHYAAAYVADPINNARCAEALFAELADWLANSPVSLTYFPLQPGDRWRYLEVAIRSGFNWPPVFALVKDSPLLSDRLLVDWIKSFYVHARHLEVNAELFGAHSDEVWGPQKLQPAVTTRHVFFLKPDIWVVIDAFRPLDEKPHATIYLRPLARCKWLTCSPPRLL